MARTRAKHSPNVSPKPSRVKPNYRQQQEAAERYHYKRLEKTKPNKKFNCSSYPLNAFKQMSNSQKIIFSLTILMFGYAFIQMSRRAFSDTSSNGHSLVCNPHHLFNTNNSISDIPKETSLVLSDLSILAKKSDCRSPYTTLNSPEVCYIQTIDPDPTSGIYVLKEHFSDDLNRANALEIKFNQEFVQCNLGIQHANTKIFSIDDKLYSGSKFISEFQSLESYMAPLAKLQNKKDHASFLVKFDFGDDTIPQLAVAFTFIDDLHQNNVGFNENGLVIVDSDKKIPTKNILSYLQLNSQSVFRFPFNLSGNDLLRMKEIYIKMQSIPLPDDPTHVGLSSDIYQSLITHSIDMCDRIYKRILALKIDMTAPTRKVNRLWAVELANLYKSEKESVEQQYMQKILKVN